MKQPKTIEEWKESISGHKIGVIIISRNMYNSAAFRELSKKHSYVSVLLAALDQVYFEKKTKNNRGKRRLQNGGIIYLPQNMLKARGIRSNKTIAEAKRRLVELGFLDVVETGSVHHAAVFRISDRWREYPNGDYRPKDNKLPGKSLHEEYGLKSQDHPVNKKRREKKKTSVQEMNVAPVQEMNVAELDSIQKMNEERPEIFQ